MKSRVLWIAGVMLAAGQVQAAILVHTTDFISNGSRTHFNGFESIPNDGIFFTGGSGPYTEDTIQVEQVNASGGNPIWVNYVFGTGFEGNFGWYPNGGDLGYSVISLAGGADFDSVGFNIGTGSSSIAEYLYELLDNNSVVLSGSVSGASTYLGFSGGGFDTIRVRDSNGGGTVTDGSFQTMAFDSIETFSPSAAVPEPASVAMLVTGALGLMLAHRRRRQIAT